MSKLRKYNGKEVTSAKRKVPNEKQNKQKSRGPKTENWTLERDR